MIKTAEELQERPGGTTMRGNALTLLGPELKPGDAAPDFEALSSSMQPVNLETTGRSVRIFSVVPSLDTPVCDAQTKRFNDEASKLDASKSTPSAWTSRSPKNAGAARSVSITSKCFPITNSALSASTMGL